MGRVCSVIAPYMRPVCGSLSVVGWGRSGGLWVRFVIMSVRVFFMFLRHSSFFADWVQN